MSSGLLDTDVSDLVGLPERIEERLSTDGPPARCLAFNRWGTILAAGCSGGLIALFDYQTRGVACHLQGGHSSEADVTALLWSADGRTLLSGAADGSLAGWDVAAGTRRFQLQLPPSGGAVVHLAWAGRGQGCMAAQQAQQLGGQPDHLQHPQRQQQQQQLGEEEVLVSRGAAPALLLSLQGEGQQRELPMVTIALEAPQPSSSSRVSVGSEVAPVMGPLGQVAVMAHDGQLIYAGSRGMLLVLRRHDLSLLDVHKIEGCPRIVSLQLHPSGRRLLVTTSDLHVRIYLLHRPGDRQPLRSQQRLARAAGSWNVADPEPQQAAAAAGAPPARQQQQGQQEQQAGQQGQGQQQAGQESQAWGVVSLEEARQLASRPARYRSSLFYGDTQAWLTQQLDFVSENGGRGRPWRCAAFSADGEYFAAACEGGGQVVYLYEADLEARQNAVLEGQGAKSSVVSLCWHPSFAPMQLLALSSAGWIDIWAKAFTENWSAFAPDFNELKVNDEYFEPEDEFDRNPRPEEEAAAAAAAEERQAAAEAEEAGEINIGVHPPAGLAHLGPDPCGLLPLLHLPLRLEPLQQQPAGTAGQPAGAKRGSSADGGAAAPAPASAAAPAAGTPPASAAAAGGGEEAAGAGEEGEAELMDASPSEGAANAASGGGTVAAAEAGAEGEAPPKRQRSG